MQRLEPEFSEFIRQVESRFGIRIAAVEAEQLTTPRAVVDYLLRRRGRPGGDTCLSRHFFYILRGAIVSHLGIPRTQVRPAVRLDVLLPRAERRQAWDRLRVAVGARLWPNLRRADWLERTVWYGGTLSGAAVLAGGAAAGLSGGVAVLLGFATALAVGVFLGRLGRPLEVAVPVGYECVDDLVRLMVADASPAAPEEERPWSREQITAVVGEILARDFRVRQWLPDARFDEDLGFE
jgi:hypothetical protein